MEENTLKEAQKIIDEFVKERHWERPSSDTFIHLVEEIGEVGSNILIMKDYGGGHTKDKLVNLEEELADVLYLLLKLANENNVDLQNAFTSKIEKIRNKFPANK
ncbi:pyrophosphatase [Candidatus Pacearchaeota archaeon]|nr:pyrophosphatase [Candidatus Pacearchaeota archaeon]